MLNDALYNTDEVIDLLQVKRIDVDRYLGNSHFKGNPRTFGGQILAQGLHAAAHTVDHRRPVSLHAMFTSPGDARLTIEYQVDRVRDGGSFSSRRVVAFQGSREICHISLSFQKEEDGMSHHQRNTSLAIPERMQPHSPHWRHHPNGDTSTVFPAPVDFRCEDDDCFDAPFTHAPHQKIWARTPNRLPHTRLTHETLLTYISDYGLIWTALKPHGIAPYDADLQAASLDHTIWFHRPFRLDDWLLFSMASPNASGGRGLNIAHVYDHQGGMVATVAQEGLIRLNRPHQGVKPS